MGLAAFLAVLAFGATSVLGQEGASSGAVEASAALAGVWAAVWVALAVAVVVIAKKRGWLRRDAYEGRREIGGLGALEWLVLAVAAYFIQGLAGISVGGQFGGENTLTRTSAMTLAGGVAVVGVWWALRVFALRGKRHAGLLVVPRDGFTGVMAFLIALPLVSVAGFAAQGVATFAGQEVEPLAHETLRLLSENRSAAVFWLTALAVVVAAPVAEEVVFRGFLQTGLRRLGLGAVAATAAASALFLLVHLPVLDGVLMPALFALSMVLGLSFERTGRLGTPIVAHACFNAFKPVGVWRVRR